MTLFEAKRLAEKAGYVVKKNHEVTKKDFTSAKYDKDTVEIDDEHDIKVKKKQRKLRRACPCCGHVHCRCSSTVKEAYRIVREAGFRVISEKFGDDEGTDLSAICTKFLSGSNPESFENITRRAGLDVAKAEFLSAIKPLVGNGLSPQKYNQIAMILGKYKNFGGALLYIAGLMHTAEGRGLNYRY